MRQVKYRGNPSVGEILAEEIRVYENILVLPRIGIFSRPMRCLLCHVLYFDNKLTLVMVLKNSFLLILMKLNKCDTFLHEMNKYDKKKRHSVP